MSTTMVIVHYKKTRRMRALPPGLVANARCLAGCGKVRAPLRLRGGSPREVALVTLPGVALVTLGARQGRLVWEKSGRSLSAVDKATIATAKQLLVAKFTNCNSADLVHANQNTHTVALVDGQDEVLTAATYLARQGGDSRELEIYFMYSPITDRGHGTHFMRLFMLGAGSRDLYPRLQVVAAHAIRANKEAAKTKKTSEHFFVKMGLETGRRPTGDTPFHGAVFFQQSYQILRDLATAHEDEDQAQMLPKKRRKKKKEEEEEEEEEE